ncbi:hypothetical protein PGTUg99_010269 [Puccinia graminis f. sp. tritici]|uniref:Uncharacterized protein n=1 Tax=Puccinia graminis f. sp. tritici TaxID=56615 RepID=A0A5B0S4S1_PUCGR|nr:hypothetical protein PGTUg99_010269 [Puccinia graminis f. sp. tritici]
MGVRLASADPARASTNELGQGAISRVKKAMRLVGPANGQFKAWPFSTLRRSR